MRLPKEMRQPGALFRPWMVPLVGIGVLLLVLLFFASVPLGDSPYVLASDLPRARFLQARGHAPKEPVVLIASGRLHADGRAVAPARAVEVLKSHARGGSVMVQAHRNAPWRSLRDLVQAAAEAGVALEVALAAETGGYGYLTVHCVGDDTGLPPRNTVSIRSLPLPDPEAVRRETERTHGDKARRFGPVVLVLDFEPPGDPDVQAVVSLWECYADPDNSVYLRSFR